MKSSVRPRCPHFPNVAANGKWGIWVDCTHTPLAAPTKAGRGDAYSVVYRSRPTYAVDVKGPGMGQSWARLILQRAESGQGEEALKLCQQMLRDGVEPGSNIFVALLKTCKSLQDLRRAQMIHAEVVKHGLETDLYVGTMLVNAYTKCGSLQNARRVFEEMPCHDVVCWTAMIMGYAQLGKGQEALQLYGRMQQEGVAPNDRTYVGALKACSSIAESEEGALAKTVSLATVRDIHLAVRKGKFECDMFVGNMLVDAYAKCGSLEEARGVFEGMPRRDVVSWTAMILGYAQVQKGEEALRLYSRMQQEGVARNDRTYIGALKACISFGVVEERKGDDRVVLKRKWLEAVRAIHKDIGKEMFESNVFLGNMLVDAYAKCGSLEDARQVFEKMFRRDVVSWNCIILACSQLGKGEEALQLYTRMRQNGVVPNDRTYIAALKACSSMAEVGNKEGSEKALVRKQCLETVASIHADVGQGKSKLDAFLATMLVDAYAKCGSLENARQVFDKMPRRDVVSWTAMILGYAQMDKGQEAWQLYICMREEGVVPDDRAYVGALKACSSIAESGNSDVNEGKFARKQCLEAVRVIHDQVVNGTLELDGYVGNMLVDAYVNCGSLENARLVFERMPHRDVVSWTAMISGYVLMEKGEEALQLYTRMQQEGVAPDDRTYVGALNACGAVAGLEKGKEIHAQILKAGLETDSYLTNSLIDMYAKCSSMLDAQQVFDATATTDIVAWNALLMGYARQGESEAVFNLFSRMNQQGVQPDDITFLGVLTACSQVGLVDRGLKYFEAMSKDYGVTPTIQHYNCMVDLFGRAGQLHKAMEMVNMMAFQPDNVMWKCVLSACLKWGNVELARKAFACAVALDESDGAPYVLMSNIYGAAHMPDEAKRIQAMRMKSKAWKEPGRSWWVDGQGKAHVFTAEDEGHPEGDSIYAKLGEIQFQLETEKYVPRRVPLSFSNPCT